MQLEFITQIQQIFNCSLQISHYTYWSIYFQQRTLFFQHFCHFVANLFHYKFRNSKHLIIYIQQSIKHILDPQSLTFPAFVGALGDVIERVPDWIWRWEVVFSKDVVPEKFMWVRKELVPEGKCEFWRKWEEFYQSLQMRRCWRRCFPFRCRKISKKIFDGKLEK